MKKIFLSAMLAVFAFGLTSCNDDNDELTDSHLTYYPVIELVGDEEVLLPVGTSYDEQGCQATLQGEDVSDQVSISGTVDSNKTGIYHVTYTVTNPDGYSASTSRTVFVYNPDVTTDLSGSYTLAAGSNRTNPSTGAVVAFSGYGVTIEKVGPGIFYVSDLMGGYYDQRAGYGSNYAMTGYISLNADNSIELLSSSVAGWGDSASGWSDGAYDPATGAVSYTVNYADVFDFNIILTK